MIMNETPFERKSCYDCGYLYSAMSWWCGNKEAIKYRGTSIPGCIHCPFWKPDWKMIPKKYKTAEFGYVTPRSTKVWLILKVILITIMGCVIAHKCSAQRKPIYTALEISYVSMQVADAYTTHRGIKLGAYEANPTARWMIDNRILIPGKIVASSVFLYSCRSIHRDNPKLATAYLIAGNLIYGAVVYNNYQVCLKMRI